MPVSLCIAPWGGWLADAHGPAGYIAVQAVGLTLSLCAFVGLTAVVREPRTGQEIYVRLRRM